MGDLPRAQLALGMPGSKPLHTGTKSAGVGLVLQQPSYCSVSPAWHRCWSLLGQTPRTACFVLLLSVLLYLSLGIGVVSHWELKQLVSHHCSEIQRCFAEGATNW